MYKLRLPLFGQLWKHLGYFLLQHLVTLVMLHKHSCFEEKLARFCSDNERSHQSKEVSLPASLRSVLQVG